MNKINVYIKVYSSSTSSTSTSSSSSFGGVSLGGGDPLGGGVFSLIVLGMERFVLVFVIIVGNCLERSDVLLPVRFNTTCQRMASIILSEVRTYRQSGQLQLQERNTTSTM